MQDKGTPIGTGTGERRWRPFAGLALRAYLVLTLLLVLLPLVGAVGWLSYRSTSTVAEQFEQQVADEIGRSLRDKVENFFDIPQRVVAYNVDLARAGLLGMGDPDLLERKFLLQIRQYPLLTFVSMGTATGEYYAASRPPLGQDRSLRVMHARTADGLGIRIFALDAADRRAGLIAQGNPNFDARTRPWFIAAREAGGPRWYGPYRYRIDDDRGAYDAAGMGMSAPLYDGTGQFLGVVTADLALSQLSDFLRSAMAASGGVAFLTDGDGALMATSAPDDFYRLDGDRFIREKAQDYANPVIRATSRAIAATGTRAGNAIIDTPAGRQLIRWESVGLPGGPTLTIGLSLPVSLYEAPLRRVQTYVLAMVTVIVLLGIWLSLFGASLISRPLVTLSHWAARLAAGEWEAKPPVATPIHEVRQLARALGSMAGHLQTYTRDLEQRVAERTAALKAANDKLSELSATDSLTGLANRRRFDEALETEWARAARAGRPLAVILADVDHFKAYNDRYGHQAGDECLRRVAAVLRAGARRPGDLAARYGGEEFCLILAETDTDAALQVAENLRQAVQNLAIPHEGSPHGLVTLSLGLAAMVPEAGRALRDHLQAADRALYGAKEAGRNRTAASGLHSLSPAAQRHS